MDEYRMYRNKYNVHIENGRWKAQNIKRDKSHCPGEKYIDKMSTASGQPIHILGRMMYGMETP